MKEFDIKILCPVCKFDYVHFEVPEWENCQNTGAFIKIPMWCEEDHKWNLVIEHHKGQSFIYCETENIIPFKTQNNE